MKHGDTCVRNEGHGSAPYSMEYQIWGMHQLVTETRMGGKLLQGEEHLMIKIALWTGWSKAMMSEERGAGLAEYALLLFVVAVAATATVTAFGGDVISAFQAAIDTLPAG
ncbi:MAG: hypothetical protein ACR2QK_14965 [Acidimicrobiales bacterium]